MEAVAKGVLSGLGYGLLVGPLFFLTVKVTISQGYRHGIALVAGAFTSDSILVVTSWWGAGKLERISNDPFFQNWIGLFSGLLLLGFGLFALWPKKKNLSADLAAKMPTGKRVYTYLQGFLINSSNPSNWLFWLSVATVAKTASEVEDVSFSRIFMVAALLTLFTTDVVKAYLAHRIGSKLKPNTTEKIIRIAGLILTCLSIWILISVYRNW
ncbi:MAG: LysE family transporter [Saprospiraceae bacterium]|nr:LysE family transporter [Saprospiraceae bacterium]MCB9342345.1 LysE family transporter [Lewinellaceae bacterium]